MLQWAKQLLNNPYMDFLQNFRQKLFESSLDKKLSNLSVDKQSVNFEASKKIGILFDVTNPVNEKCIWDYAEKLKHQGKDVDLLAYVNDNIRHNNYAFRHFNKKDLNWIYQPKIQMVEAFMEKKFDILFCFYVNILPPLEYVAGLSKAHMRVGSYQEDKIHCLDLMVDTGKTTDMATKINLIDQFVRLVNRTVS